MDTTYIKNTCILLTVTPNFHFPHYFTPSFHFPNPDTPPPPPPRSRSAKFETTRFVKISCILDTQESFCKVSDQLDTWLNNYGLISRHTCSKMCQYIHIHFYKASTCPFLKGTSSFLLGLGLLMLKYWYVLTPGGGGGYSLYFSYAHMCRQNAPLFDDFSLAGHLKMAIYSQYALQIFKLVK